MSMRSSPTTRAGSPVRRRAPGRYGAKTRYRQADAACALAQRRRGRRARAAFDAPQWAVTPGQSAVLYDGEVCLGGAVIGSPSMAARFEATLASSS